MFEIREITDLLDIYSGVSNILFSIGGTTDIGPCCRCDLFDRDGNLIRHIPQFTLFMCFNPGCNHYICEKHRQPCGFCEGCCAEEHGLDSHRRIQE